MKRLALHRWKGRSMESSMITALISGGIGATAALLGVYLSNKSAELRHRLDIRQREQEIWTSFVLPVATLRANACEETYDLLQDAIEVSSLSEEKYLRIRRLLIYLPEGLQGEITRALTAIIIAKREKDLDTIKGAAEQLRRAKSELRKLLGLEAIEAHMSTIISPADRT
jgi:hypothetical protein